MFLVRGNIPDALDFAAHLVAKKILTISSPHREKKSLLFLLAKYMEYRYVADYVNALYRLIDLGYELYGVPDSGTQYWLQLEVIVEELALPQNTIRDTRGNRNEGEL